MLGLDTGTVKAHLFRAIGKLREELKDLYERKTQLTSGSTGGYKGRVERMSARHWSAAELIAHLYGVGPENEHLVSCADCQKQLAEMAGTRAAHEAIDRGGEEISDGFLAAQRRQIYSG